jgi:hypothetical protein
MPVFAGWLWLLPQADGFLVGYVAAVCRDFFSIAPLFIVSTLVRHALGWLRVCWRFFGVVDCLQVFLLVR